MSFFKFSGPKKLRHLFVLLLLLFLTTACSSDILFNTDLLNQLLELLKLLIQILTKLAQSNG